MAAMTKRQIMLLGFCGLVVLMFRAEASWAQGEWNEVVVRATKHVVVPPLSQIAPIPPRSERVNSLSDGDDDRQPMRVLRFTGPVRDSALQRADSLTSGFAPLSTKSGLNILGLGAGFPGYNIQGNVPDTNGAVGTTQFVQFVNESFAVFNKSDGSLAYGPAGGDTLWQALGGGCAANTNLDEVVEFDTLANRWVILMPDFYSPPFLCIAVSTTSDAVNGGWNLYAFRPPGNPLCNCRMTTDYPKLAVWPDGYYLSYNLGLNLQYQGVEACVFDRNSMLNGAAATMQCFAHTGTSFGSFLPGDLDGTTPPPAGSPAYYLNFDSNDQSLDLWRFHVDWTTPANSTFTGPTNIPVAAFTEACGETVVELNYTTGACIPQAGTSQGLDSYGDRLMYRLAYRNFGTHESLVANHTVTTGTNGSQTGIRWYELRNSSTGFKVYQEGTYAPDSNYRWMGSIAMDKAGDIALGYSVSSSTISPSIRYTGRVPADPLGQMEGETDVLSSAGIPHGSHTSTYRWGDYSSLAIDSTDDCTFWYTTEYQPTNANNHWSTRIASFRFPSCSTPWAIVNKASNAGSITSLTVPATAAGHLIAVAIMFNGGTSVANVSDNANGGSNTYVSAGARATVSGLSVEIWYAVNSKANANVVTPTFVGSPTYVGITSWEVSGISLLAPDAKKTASGQVVSNNTAGPAVTTSKADDFIVSVLFANGARFSGISSGNEFTDDFATDGNGLAHITSNLSSVGTHRAVWLTAHPAGVYCASTVAFFAAE